MEIKLVLSLEEVNGVLTSLSQQPYNQVVALIQKVQLQAAGQLKPAEVSAPKVQTQS